MADFSTTVFHGLLICIPFTAFVLISFLGWPRLWLHSLPKDIIEMAPPKTITEERLTKYLLLPVFLLILPGLSILSVLYLAATTQVDFSFVGLLVHIYTIWIIVHLWDLIVLDGIAMLLINPEHPPIAGTEGAKGWSDYGFHFQSFIKASVRSALFVVPAAVILSFFL